MFELESRDGRGTSCSVHPDGVRPPGLPLEEDELVYGVYKSRFYYSPQALIIDGEEGCSRIPWSQVTRCSTKHGDGNKISTLILSDGRSVIVPISEFVTGWAGRTSQLYHGMIERWGAQAAFGSQPLTVAEFFDRAADAYSFAPNLEPHPSLEAIRTELG